MMRTWYGSWLLLAAATTAVWAADGPSATVTGEITDAQCYLEKGKEGLGPAHRDCAIRCIKEGRPPLIRDEQTGALYLGTLPGSTPKERDRWLKQIGNRVRVTGRVEEREGLRLLEVVEIKGEHDHDAAPHGGVVGMTGNRHLELVATADNEIQVYVLDEFLKPLTVAGVTGKAVVKAKDGAVREATLTSDPRHEFLVARGTSRAPDDDSVEVTVALGKEPVRMTLPFAEGDGGAAAHHPHH